MRDMADRAQLVDSIAGFALFADLPQPRLEGIVHLFEEAVFAEGEKVLRQGLTGSGFYVIIDGEAAIVVDGEERARLGRGEFFGEVSILLGESPIADVVATRPLRCLLLPGSRVEAFLVDHPRVMYRMLQAQARRLRAANRWRS
jgi:CRP-like cAMP-binding protein